MSDATSYHHSRLNLVAVLAGAVELLRNNLRTLFAVGIILHLSFSFPFEISGMFAWVAAFAVFLLVAATLVVAVYVVHASSIGQSLEFRKIGYLIWSSEGKNALITVSLLFVVQTVVFAGPVLLFWLLLKSTVPQIVDDVLMVGVLFAGVIYVLMYFAVPVAVVEGASVGQAVLRSVRLSEYNRIRILGLVLIVALAGTTLDFLVFRLASVFDPEGLALELVHVPINALIWAIDIAITMSAYFYLVPLPRD